MAPPVTSLLAITLVGLLALSAPGGAMAQAVDEELAPPHLSIVEGSVRLERGGEVVQAEVGHILAVGDRLRTDRGRFEVVFGDGSALHVDERTTFDLLDDWLIRLLDGRVFLHVATPPEDLPLIIYRIDTPAATVRATMPGEYRVSSGGRPEVTDVAVARGLAEVIGSGGAVALHAGERVQARNGQPGPIAVYNAAAWDSFDRWSYDRRLAWTDGAHAAHLPRQLTPYASTLAHHGTWSHHPTYGAVWYPHVVADWRPFYHGRWTVLSPYGWTWVGVDPWAWPTHYYGSWSVVSGRWFWIPGRAWSPARVHWVVAPGYVGWLPFGPVGVVHHVGWTIVPRTVFHINVIVPRHAINVYSLRADVRRTFVAQRPPEPSGVAVPRASVIAAERTRPTRTAVSRAGEPAAASAASTAGTAAARRTPTAALRDGAGATGAGDSRTAVRAGDADRTATTGTTAIRRAPPGDAASGTAATTPAGAADRRTAGTAISRVPSTTATPSAAGGTTAGRTAASRAPEAPATSSEGGAAARGVTAFPRTTPSTPGTRTATPAPAPSAGSPATRGAVTRTAPAASPAQAPAAPAPAAGGGTRAVPRGAPAGEPAAPAAAPAPAERAPASGGARAVPRSSSSTAPSAAPARTGGSPVARTPAVAATGTTAPATVAPRTATPARVTAPATAPAGRVAPSSVPATSPATTTRPPASGVSRAPATVPARPATATAPAAARRAPAAAPSRPAATTAPVRAAAPAAAPRATASAPPRASAPPATSSPAGGRRAPAAAPAGRTAGGGARQR